MVTDSIEISQKKEKTEMVLMNVASLPVIPKVMSEALKLLDNQFTTAAELTKVIMKDQALVTKLLTIANSPLYGLQRKVTTVDFAIMILGHKELRGIISALSISEAFKNKTDKYLNQKQFILHSYLTGTAARKLSQDFGFKNSGEAFITGFLHDIGFSVMHRYMHSNFVKLFELVESNTCSLQEAEYEVNGMTHEEIGSYLLDKWNFPVEITNTVCHHHNPDETIKSPILGTIVNLADYMTLKLKIGEFTFDNNLTLSPSTMKKFNFENEFDVERYMKEYKDIFWSQLDFIRFLN